MQNPSPSSARGPVPVRAVIAASEAILSVEKIVVGGLMALVLALILLNVVTRYSGMPLYWVDEAAVYAMVWLSFIGASTITRLRLDFSVTLLSDKLSEKGARRLQALASLTSVIFAIALLAMCWMWMDPLGIAAAGFDARAYAAQSFNFLYTEQTQTLRWPAWVVSLVIPLFAVSMTVHLLANLLEDVKLSPRIHRHGFSSGEGVN